MPGLSRSLRPGSAITAVAAVLMLLAGCGNRPATPMAPDGQLEKTDISVGALPLADYAAVYWAADHGFFAQKGLNVTLVPLQGGPVGIQKVLAGEVDFSFANPISSSIAASKGAPVMTVVLSSSIGAGGISIWVKPDSPIKQFADLDGKSIGINTLNNIGDVTFRNLAKFNQQQVEPKFVEVPFPEMVAAVESGAIDAGYTPEPFASAAEAAGLRRVVDLTVGPNTEFPASTFVASTSFVEQNPDTVQAFYEAMYAAGIDIRGKQAEFRAWLPGIAKLPPETANSMVLPVFAGYLDVTKLESVANMLEGQGLAGPVDVLRHTYAPPMPRS